jgi:LysM repeat protein
MEIITYTVKPNDTIWGIAQAFEIEVETIMWANPEVERDPDLLSVGQILTVLPVNGVYYTVKSGDTVEKLAKTFKSTPEKITGFELNGLSAPYKLATGQKLVIPDGKKPLPQPRPIYYPLQVVGNPPVSCGRPSAIGVGGLAAITLGLTSPTSPASRSTPPTTAMSCWLAGIRGAMASRSSSTTVTAL